MVMGLPVLYLYLFFAWAALIGLMALAIEKMGGGERVTSAKVAARKPEIKVPEANGKD